MTSAVLSNADGKLI